MIPGNLIIRNTHLPFHNPSQAATLYDVVCEAGVVCGIAEARGMNKPPDDGSDVLQAGDIDAQGGILLPSLCHAHIHLDKCFLLDTCGDKLVTGDFTEALRVTAEAKTEFPLNLDDLYDRGRRLILESVESGVTCMRAHVEVDATVAQHCVRTGLRLKQDLARLGDVQIAVFAQDPLFPIPTTGDSNYAQMLTAVTLDGVEVVGSAPYVESSTDHAKQNIRFILDLAFKHHLHADFHLDYNLDTSQEPLIWYLLEELQDRIRTNRWHGDSHVCVGHATRLTLFGNEEWTTFRDTTSTEDAPLPITLVGLPQSDLYMMGRNFSPVPRGTLDVVKIKQRHGVDVAMAVNNVGNAFTPQGPPDPLALCPLGVAVFQAGTSAHAYTSHLSSLLLFAFQPHVPSTNPTVQHWHPNHDSEPLLPRLGSPADFVLAPKNTSVQSVVTSPSYDRVTIRAGRIVARRVGVVWNEMTG
ncbi:Metallo-dependent hydrolase [Cristinia sonorae]|uniref:Metallo-dependent hydrolase n=1 Tax=Cristinia sonorae TaxID=1940300 RepID=A0A8K0UVC8_9AGAR|nr:Metallo-dependent hydrolase [Cristinia sonorae]